MTIQSLLASHALVTPVDVALTLLASAAVIIAWYRERGLGSSLTARKGRGMRFAVIWARWFLGAHALFSGPNYFLHLYPQAQMVHPLAGPLQHYMEAVGLFGVIKAIESIVGVCLILDVYVPAAAMLEMPVTFTIFYLSVFVVADPRTLWTGPRELILNAFILAAYGGWFADILRPRLSPRPLWSQWPGAPAAGSSTPHRATE
ncbi:MAG TPA: hypothetical protein VMC02_11060 [Steroidobacteraceae bacterium]|nr:hypothetical protein [Steroidobacteraceae bacterium]